MVGGCQNLGEASLGGGGGLQLRQGKCLIIKAGGITADKANFFLWLGYSPRNSISAFNITV